MAITCKRIGNIFKCKGFSIIGTIPKDKTKEKQKPKSKREEKLTGTQKDTKKYLVGVETSKDNFIEFIYHLRLKESRLSAQIGRLNMIKRLSN